MEEKRMDPDFRGPGLALYLGVVLMVCSLTFGVRGFDGLVGLGVPGPLCIAIGLVTARRRWREHLRLRARSRP